MLRTNHVTTLEGIVTTVQEGTRLVELLFTPNQPLSLIQAAEVVGQLTRSFEWLLKPAEGIRRPHWAQAMPNLDAVARAEFAFQAGAVQTITVLFE